MWEARNLGAIALAAGLFAACTSSGRADDADGVDDTQPVGEVNWDPEVAEIAEEVEDIRELEFDHPVEIEFMPEDEFDELDTVDIAVIDPTELVRAESIRMRAFGLVPSDLDLREFDDDLGRQGLRGFYSPEDETITVRGTELDAGLEVILAHELTHALQDQHFGLGENLSDAATGRDALAYSALIEGDATAVMQEYLANLPRDEAEDATGSLSDPEATDFENLPNAPALSALGSAPYLFGPATVLALREMGMGFVNQAISNREPTGAVLFDASALIDSVADAEPPAVPALDPGDEQVGEPTTFGPFRLYLALLSRLDPDLALDAADSWTADTQVAFRRDGRDCTRTAFIDELDADLNIVFEQWAAAGPAGSTTVVPGDLGPTVTVCESPDAPTPSGEQVARALQVLSLRAGNFLDALQAGFEVRYAQCVANEIVDDPVADEFIDAVLEDPTRRPKEALKQIPEAKDRALDACGIPR